MILNQFQIQVCLRLLNSPNQNISCTVADLKVISKTSDALESAVLEAPPMPKAPTEAKSKKKNEELKAAHEAAMVDWNMKMEEFSKEGANIGFDKESVKLLQERVNTFGSFSAKKDIREQIIELSEKLGE